jgi:hypothetical protein
MRTIAGLIALLLTGNIVAAPKSERRAWEWTLEERIALRANPAAATERAGTALKRFKATANQAKQERIVDSFTGATHPELFLPHEVFDELMQLAFLLNPRMGDAFRKEMQPEVLRFDLPADFWERLRTISVIYIADVHRAYDNPKARNLKHHTDERERQEFNRNYEVMCRSRADALAKAREEFGAARFDRFLYEAVARNMFKTIFDTEDVNALRRAAEGCR